MHYRSTRTPFLSLDLHARSHATSPMMGFKHQQYEIFMCQQPPLEQNYHQEGFAFRSEDTTAFIPLSPSLSPSHCCVAASRAVVTAPRTSYSSVLFLVLCDVAFSPVKRCCVCVLGGKERDNVSLGLLYFFSRHVGKTGEAGEGGCLGVRKRGGGGGI